VAESGGRVCAVGGHGRVHPIPPPGTITCRQIQSAPQSQTQSAPSFTHHLSPETLVQMAQLLYGYAPPTFLWTVAGAEFGMGEGLSTAVDNALPSLIQQIRQQLEPFSVTSNQYSV
jgi:Ni,Fe-hydrogenase maturation factor